MPYEQALAHAEIARHLDAGHPERRSHEESAARILGAIGASTTGGARRD